MSEPGTGAPLTRREAIARERAAVVAAATPTVAVPPVPEAPEPAAASEPPASWPPATSPHHVSATRPPRDHTPRAPRRLARALLSGGILVVLGALVLGVSIPTNALRTPGDAAEAEAPAAHVTAGSGQRLLVDGSEFTIPTTSDDYTASTRAQLLAAKYKGGVGGQGTGPVRWPFPYPVAILSPFGPRGAVAGCPTCAPFHRGVDLNGGNGNPIGSIMAGTVTERSGGSWTYGNYAVIVGHYQGHEVKAIYEHMQEGSSPLVVGQQVDVGDFVGLVGQTGEATAPHLHLELDVDGQLIDPIPWLEANAS